MKGIDEVLHKEVIAGCQHVPALQLLQAERTEQDAEIARLRSQVDMLQKQIELLEGEIEEIRDGLEPSGVDGDWE